MYPIKDTDSTPLDLINVLTYVFHLPGVSPGVEKPALNPEDTFIGHNSRGKYIKVGSIENPSASGVIFRVRLPLKLIVNSFSGSIFHM